MQPSFEHSSGFDAVKNPLICRQLDDSIWPLCPPHKYSALIYSFVHHIFCCVLHVAAVLIVLKSHVNVGLIRRGCPQVMGEDLVLVSGQQDRMLRGADVWSHPVAYDKLGVRYRRWRNSVTAGRHEERREIENELRPMSAGELFR